MLGDRLKRLRNQRGLSQEELSKRLHLSRGTYAHYEINKRQPDYVTLQKIADFYGVTTDHLLGRDEEKYFLNREAAKKLQNFIEEKAIDYTKIRDELNMSDEQYLEFKRGHVYVTAEQLRSLETILGIDKSNIIGLPNANVAGQELNLSQDELRVFAELKKHPILFNELASDPEGKVKELIKLYKMKKMFLEDDAEEYGEGFGDIDD